MLQCTAAYYVFSSGSEDGLADGQTAGGVIQTRSLLYVLHTQSPLQQLTNMSQLWKTVCIGLGEALYV